MNSIKSGKGKTFFANASVLKRIAAFVIDILIINLIVLFPFIRIMEKMLPEINSFSDLMEFLSVNAELSKSITILLFIFTLFHIFYFVIFEKKLSQSIGKMLFNLYVKSQTNDLKYWQLFVRSFFFLLPNFLKVIDFAVMLFTKENQRLSEILSKTKVVEQYNI